MNFPFKLPGPHDIPFAAPVWGGVITGLIIGYFIFKIMDLFIHNEESDS